MFSYKKTAIITITILTILHTENVCDKTFVFCFQVVPSFIYYFPGYGQLEMKNNFFFVRYLFFKNNMSLRNTKSWCDCIVGHASVSLPEIEQEENQVFTQKRNFQQEDKILS